MPRLAFLIIITALLIHLNTIGQINNSGLVTSTKPTPSGFSGKTTNSNFDIRTYNANIYRIRLTSKGKFSELNYALAGKEPEPPQVTKTETKDKLILDNGPVKLVVEKSPAFRVILYNKEGQVITEDMPGAALGTAFMGDKVTVYRKMQEGERFIGLGEALGDLDRRGSGVTLNNTDNYRYDDVRVPMYSSIPFFIGLHHGLVYGIFYNNSFSAYFNFGISADEFSSVSFAGGDLDYFLITGNTVADIIKEYTSLTGRMPLPPRWSLGYQQSRCSYYPQSVVQQLAETFRNKHFPVDGIVLDADYLQDYEPFRINTHRFPDMPGLAKNLAAMHIELTASVNPGIKLDSTYVGNNDGLKEDIFLKYTDGRRFVAPIAPSTNHFPDFTDPRARAWWVRHMKFLPDNGIHGYWNDMNEPAVGGSYLPDNIDFNFDRDAKGLDGATDAQSGQHRSASVGAEGRGRQRLGANTPEAKNLYGMLMARSSYEAAVANGGNRRPFILTRSGFAGVQRYSAIWSGDNQAKDEHLLLGNLLNNQLGLSGVPFVGADVGGYIGDGTKELFKRWIEVGAFYPYMRNHKEFFATANEPWSYGEEGEAIARNYVGFRYKLMPYLYSAFYEATQTGMPVARSLAITDPFDDKIYDHQYQYETLFGPSILLAPVTSKEKIKKLYLPKGEWYDLYTDAIISGPKEWMQEFPVYQLPLYVKASAIIPMQRAVESTQDHPGDTLFVHVYIGSEVNNYVWYDDAGDGLEYKEGVYAKRLLSLDPKSKTIEVSAQEGKFSSPFKQLCFILHGFGEKPFTIEVNGVKQSSTAVSRPVLDVLDNMQEIYDPSYYKSLRSAEVHPVQQQISVQNITGKIILRY